LGAGFDALGMAVRKYVTASFEPGGAELSLRREGTLAELEGPLEDDLLRRAFVGELGRLGVDRVGGTLVVGAEVPIGRGLGTSAASTVGGLMLAHAVLGEDQDKNDILSRAAALEGHPDNAAPSIFGGLVGMAPKRDGGFRVFSLPLSPDVAFTYAAPETRVSTAEARRVMPDSYRRATAVQSLARVVSLLQGLEHGDGEALALGLEDDIHVPYRLPLIPGGAEAMRAAVDAGAWGATISGSGSGIVALSMRDAQPAVLTAMKDSFRRAGSESVVAFVLEPERDGAQADAL
jgi:homoserine kinase